MKKLLILTIFGALLGGLSGCRFMDCLFRGPAYRSCPPPVACPNPCSTYDSCNACDAGAAVPVATPPGPVTYAPSSTQ